jgi:hypothetical protein
MVEVACRNHKDWPSFTFHRYLEEGLYPANLGEEVSFSADNIFGE